MRAVAKELDCEAMSLYRHVPSKAALLELVGATVAAEIEVPDPDHGRAEDVLRELLRELRRVALRHPAAFALLSRGPIDTLGPEPLEAGMRALRRSGLDAERAASALCVLLAYATGAIANELAAHALGEPLARAADAAGWGEASQARSFLELMERTGYEEEFEFGLQTLLRGLESGLR